MNYPANGPMHGYSSAAYADSLAEFGEPRLLPASRAWVLERKIPGTEDRDAMGCYPLLTCQDWSALGADLDLLARDVVSLAAVPDPFAPLAVDDLRRHFDVVAPFKPHYVYDLSVPIEKGTRRHHRYYGRKSLTTLTVETCTDLPAFLGEWGALYAVLIARHGLTGMKAFSSASFRRQFDVPGLVALRVTLDGVPVAGQLWFVQGDVAFSHLTAVSEEGYRMRATYGLYHYAINHFAERFAGTVKWLDLGGGAGSTDGDDGLSEFKRGWSTGTRQAYFCGRVFDRARYDALVRERCEAPDSYFPAYRKGEFLKRAPVTADTGETHA